MRKKKRLVKKSAVCTAIFQTNKLIISLINPKPISVIAVAINIHTNNSTASQKSLFSISLFIVITSLFILL